MKPPSAGNCVGCQELVALRPDASCPNCGLRRALRHIPSRLQVIRPDLKRSMVYTAVKVVAYCAVPVLTLFGTTELLDVFDFDSGLTRTLLLMSAPPVGLVLALVLGPALGALLVHLPWLVVQLLNVAIIGPYQAFRRRKPVGPTFQGAFAALADRRTELSEQLNQMLRTLGKMRDALQTRGPDAAHSKQRLATGEKALRSGVQARRDALEAVDAVWYEVELQRLECKVAALRLLPCETAGAAKSRLTRLQQVESRIREIGASVNALQDAGRRGRALHAWQSAIDCVRAARDHFHAVEDGGLLAQAALLLQDVEPTREHHHATPYVDSFETFDQSATLLRVSAAVAECVEQRLRVEAELEAVAEVDAIVDLESAGPPARRALRGGR